MLNWDDYGKEEANTSSAVAAAPVVETPQVVKEQPAPAAVDTAAPIEKSTSKTEEGSRAHQRSLDVADESDSGKTMVFFWFSWLSFSCCLSRHV